MCRPYLVLEKVSETKSLRERRRTYKANKRRFLKLNRNNFVKPQASLAALLNVHASRQGKHKTESAVFGNRTSFAVGNGWGHKNGLNIIRDNRI